jgi:hypothetical protein
MLVKPFPQLLFFLVVLKVRMNFLIILWQPIIQIRFDFILEVLSFIKELLMEFFREELGL